MDPKFLSKGRSLAAEAVSRLEREQLSCVDRALPSLRSALDVAE